MSEYKYALEGDYHELVYGDELRLAYSGAGVATLVDRKGSGFKVPVGTRNLAAIDGEDLILADSGDGPIEEDGATEDGSLYDEFDRNELHEECHKRGLKMKGNLKNIKYIAALVAWDEQHAEESGAA